MTNERLQGEYELLSKNYLFEIPRSHAKSVWKVHHENWTL